MLDFVMDTIYQSRWVNSQLPLELIQAVERQCSELKTYTGTLRGNVTNSKIRNNGTCFLPETHWIATVMRQTVEMLNSSNFLYDLHPGFDNHEIQYGVYKPGQYYKWHKDMDIYFSEDAKRLRKLSVTLQLSSEDEYEGGEMQLQSDDGSLYTCPKKQGTIIVFDSRALHRVRPVKSGVRKSLVGWVTGPRWR